jgi:hypothetical protein
LIPLLVGGLWLFLERRYGWPLALAGCVLVAFSPGVIAHAAVAGTDACFLAFGALCAFALVG